MQRDREQRHALIQAQLKDRQALQTQIKQTRDRHAQRLRDLHKDCANYRLMQRGEAPKVRDAFERLEALRMRESQQSQDIQSRLERLRLGRKDNGHGPDLER